MNTQFQLGFELTNILNPVSQAVTTISSIALADAIRKAGSDAMLRQAGFAVFLCVQRLPRLRRLVCTHSQTS